MIIVLVNIARSDSPQVVVLTNRTALDQPADVALREGDGVLMQCDVRAKPADNVHLLWYRDGVPIKHANTRMLAVQVREDSSGRLFYPNHTTGARPWLPQISVHV
jgi:hypothetical protein